jgi:signal transduction histidine kinase
MGVLERLVGASMAQRPFAERLPRRRHKTAWVVAVICPLLLTLGQRAAGSSVPPAAVLFVTLFVVVAVALLGGMRPALVAILTGLIAQEIVFEFPYGSLNDHDPAQISILVVFVVIGAGIGILVDELAWLSTEQAALRRLATLVARGVPPVELFSAVADEVASLLDVDSALVAHLDADGMLTILAAGGAHADEFVAGQRLFVEPSMAVAKVLRTGRPARADDYHRASPGLRVRIERMGVRASVATPIDVEGQVWGAVVASSWRGPLPSDTEQRMLDFTELVATAIAHAESHAALAASRARIVAAADESRRQIERDLHDGAQQRLVHAVIVLKLALRAVSNGTADAGELVAEALRHAEQANSELRELAHGILPAALTRGGLQAGVEGLVSRVPLPVIVDVCVERLPAAVEATAYFVVSEALTNVVKHAGASRAEVSARLERGELRIDVRDDGVGGAQGGEHTGLGGLADRVSVLDGRLMLDSPPGGGTRVCALLPVPDQD